MASNGASNSSDKLAEDQLYHVKCEITDYNADPSGVTRIRDIYGTYTSLHLAKEAAAACLREVGYKISDFSVYIEKTSEKSWTYGDDVLVYAKTPIGQEFRVRLDVTPNMLVGEQKNANGEVENQLYYVQQTIIDYNTDRSGGKQTSNIQGVFLEQSKAVNAAYRVLLDEEEGLKPESFAQYDRLDESQGDWPYGDDVLVHAVGKMGENFKVEVKTGVKVHHEPEGHT